MVVITSIKGLAGHLLNRVSPQLVSSCSLLLQTRTNLRFTCVSPVVLIKRNYSSSSWKDIPSKPRYLEYGNEDSITASASAASQQGKIVALPAKQQKKRETNITEEIPVGESILQDLQSLFGMTHHEAFTTVQSPELLSVPDYIISETIHTLKAFDIPPKQLQRVPWILLQSAGELSSKIKMLTKPYLFLNYFDGLGFCYFSPDQILKFQELFSLEAITHYNNRIYYIAEKLRVPVDLLTEKIVQVPVDTVLTRDLYKVEDCLELLNKFNVDQEDILNDLWFFSRASLELTEQRLSAAVNAGYKRPKLWMARCTRKHFERALNNFQAQKDILEEFKSVEEFLAKQLGCSVRDLKQQPGFASVVRMRPKNVKKKIDMLLAEDFSSKLILSSLRLLMYSEQRTRARIRRLKEIGVTNISVGSLYITPQQFENYCLRLGKKNKKVD